MFNRRTILTWLLTVLAVLLLPAAAAGDGEAREIPEVLRFKQDQQVERLGMNRIAFRVYPLTSNAQVNEAIRQTVDSMYAEALPALPKKGVSSSLMARIDVGPYISRVGNRWMSFLTMGRVVNNHRQLYAAFDAAVYQMDTGEKITLSDVIDDQKGGWAFLADAVRAQLTAIYPSDDTDPALLDALCSEENLRAAAFTLTPGHLSLHWRADILYPERTHALMHADIYYAQLRPYMTERALRETDCSGYRFVALTYDDGPAWGPTDSLINELRLYGAGATFFTVGYRVNDSPELVKREYDAGFSVQSHGWRHKYTATRKQIQEWNAAMAEKLTDLIGVPPVMFRAPGGNNNVYIDGNAGMPLIHWNLVSMDSDGTPNDTNKVSRVGNKVAMAPYGSVVLLHDLQQKAADYARIYLPALERRNILPVTILDLCDLCGIEMLPNTVYFEDYKLTQHAGERAE